MLQGFANPAYLSGFLCSGLQSVAPYCVPGGVRVVAILLSYLHDAFWWAHLSSSCRTVGPLTLLIASLALSDPYQDVALL